MISNWNEKQMATSKVEYLYENPYPKNSWEAHVESLRVVAEACGKEFNPPENPDKNLITLSFEEIEICHNVAKKQRHDVRHGEHRVTMKNGEDAIQNHWTGACGEMAVARFFNEPYEGGVGRFKNKPDQSGFDVRTRRKMEYELNVREEDPLDRPLILVTEIVPHEKYLIRGWIHGKEVLSVPFTSPDGRKKARFVPHSMLHPMTEWKGK